MTATTRSWTRRRSACLVRTSRTRCGVVACTHPNIHIPYLEVKLEGLLTKVDSDVLILAAQQKKEEHPHDTGQARVTKPPMSACAHAQVLPPRSLGRHNDLGVAVVPGCTCRQLPVNKQCPLHSSSSAAVQTVACCSPVQAHSGVQLLHVDMPEGCPELGAVLPAHTITDSSS